MTMGLGVVLIVIGAILTFALDFQVSWINLDLVGYILMFAGAVAFIVGLIRMFMRRRTVTDHRVADPAVGERVVREERSVPGEDY